MVLRTYSVWFYKGGPRCGHKWLRRTYASFDTKIDPTNPTAKPLSNAVAENMVIELETTKSFYEAKRYALQRIYKRVLG
jgi:hypothetical protein